MNTSTEIEIWNNNRKIDYFTGNRILIKKKKKYIMYV